MRDIMPAETQNQESQQQQQNQEESQQQNQNSEQQQEQGNQGTTNFEDLVRTTLAENERSRLAAEQRARDLEDQLFQLRQAQNNNSNNQQQQNQQPDPQQFWNDPINTINNLIGRQVAPLNDFAQQIQQQNAYLMLKNQYRNQPGFNVIEPLVDQFMAGQQPTHANFQIAVQRAVGQIAITNPQALFGQQQNQGTQTQVNQQQQQQQNNQPGGDPSIIPINRGNNQQAHMRPSQVPANRTTDTQQKHRPLTENERRICKEMNITEERYWELMEKNNTVQNWRPSNAK